MTNKPITPQEMQKRAEEIARLLLYAPEAEMKAELFRLEQLPTLRKLVVQCFNKLCADAKE